MVTETLFVLAVAVVVGIDGAASVARGRIRRHGLLVILWRWLTGHTWHGRPITDAGWFRPASRALTPTGHAPKFHWLPRWKRAARRTGAALTALVTAEGMLFHRTATEAAVGVFLLASGCWEGWRLWRRLAERKHRRTWLQPLHLVLAPVVGVPLTAGPKSWLAVEPDRSRAVLELPPEFDCDAKSKERIVAVATAKLGLESPDVMWRLAGPSPSLTLTASAPPPALVTLADVMPAIKAAREDEVVWGLGKRGKVVKNSLGADSPHVGLSMGSGAGKSVTARAFLAQQLHKGAVGLILDYKMISHQWARDLPNVVIARRPHEIHGALVWLGGELERRNEVALAGADLDGNVHAVVGPRLIVVCEELNATMSRLRKHWRQVRDRDDPVRSPALDALDAASFMGRQVLCNILYIGQRLSVRASGGDGDARENIGVIAFGRYSASNWKMLAGDHPMPPKSLTPGRLQVVANDVTETQGVRMLAREARQLALSGTVSACPAGMPGARCVTAADPGVIPGPGQGEVTVSAAPSVIEPPGLVSLSDAVRDGVVACTLAALRMARHRDESFPAVRDRRGLAHLYSVEELAEWDLGRR